jgi:putative two-component system response regulator
MSAHILIVDDDPQVASLLVRLLSREGYNVSVASNGVQALAMIAQLPPDLVLLDVTMPGVDGFEVCRQIKSNERTALIPVTMLTALDAREHRTVGIESGADDFLTKPFDYSTLRARIRTQLRLKHLTDQLEHTESVIFTLALAVEAKDAYTEGHLRRLAFYGEHLALRLGMSPDEARAVRYGGILHDIGKIGVDEAILRKPGPLTELERHKVREHPEIGARIVAPLRFASQVAPIILAHHEFWNGQGYPLGLRGEQLPIGARIIGIVDSYDAMTTDRVYRKALTQQEAMQRLARGAGQQWDPELVQQFLELLDDGIISQPILQERSIHASYNAP